MFFNRKKESEESKTKVIFPAVNPRECQGDFKEYCCEDSILKLGQCDYMIRVDETGMDMGEYAELSEEYGSYTVENGCEIFINSEREVINGKETPQEEMITYHKKNSLGFFVDDRIIAPVTDVQKKGDKTIIVLGNKKVFTETYTLQNGVCEKTSSFRATLSKQKKGQMGTYTQTGNEIHIVFEKYEELFVQYSGQYYNVLYIRQ